MARRNFLGSLITKLYVVFRGEWNPVVNRFFESRFLGVPKIDFERDLVPLSRDEFKEKITSYQYISDPGKGALDFTFLDPKFFFWDELPYGRDGDDFSYMWYLWARFNGTIAYQYIIIPDFDLKKAQAVTIAKIGSFYTLYDYHKEYKSDSISDLMSVFFDENYKGKKSEKGKEYTSITYARLRQSEDMDTIRERLI